MFFFLISYIASNKYLKDINAKINIPGNTTTNLISVISTILNELNFMAIIKLFIVYPIDSPFIAKTIIAIGDSITVIVPIAIINKKLKKINEREESGDVQVSGIQKEKLRPKNIQVKNCYAGRLTLSGTIREPTQKTVREDIAQKLGFNFNKGVEFGKIKNSIKVVG